jgi:hypothetical protein
MHSFHRKQHKNIFCSYISKIVLQHLENIIQKRTLLKKQKNIIKLSDTQSSSFVTNKNPFLFPMSAALGMF